MSFDLEAATWDNDPKKVERAKIFGNEMRSFLAPLNLSRGMEFGCGTGLLSFELEKVFKELFLVDNSAGMISVLKDKISASGLKHFHPVFTESIDGRSDLKGMDAIFTLLALHHVEQIEATLKSFHTLLKSGGHLLIADLDKEDGSFHSDDFIGHNGFDRSELVSLLNYVGFEEVKYSICHEISKETSSGLKSFPLFLLIAKKS